MTVGSDVHDPPGAAGPSADPRPRPTAPFGHRRVVPPRIARRTLQSLLRRIDSGTLEVVEPGRGSTFFGRGSGPAGMLEVRDDAVWSMVLQRGSVGLGECYADGLLNSDDLVLALRVLVRNVVRLNRLGNRLDPVLDAVAVPFDRRRSASRSRDRTNVRAHYDLGNEFFELFLDESMTYSCAVFDRPGISLEQAQTAKLDRIAAMLELGSDDHVVEIGTGWGSFAIRAASTTGCRVTTTTVSARQFDLARRRVALAGLEHLVDVRNVDFRDLEGSYSKLVSIEMIEAVDWRDYSTYFSTIDRLLHPDGRAALQAIVIRDEDFHRAKRRQDFIKTHIFPGGCLPSLGAIRASLGASTSLRISRVDDIGRHYVPTLAEWRRRLDERVAEALRLGYDERFLRLWRFYLSYCEAAFEEAHVSDVQLVLDRGGSSP